MKLTDKEVLEEINDHRVIIISGSTGGRTRIRKLLVENLGQQRIIDTRNYARTQYHQGEKDGHLIEVFSLVNTTKGYEYKVLQIFLGMLEKKKKPVIVDSFTDVQLEIRGEFIRTTGKKTGEHRFQVNDRDWNIYKFMLKSTLTKLKKQKKKVILFADLKDEHDYKNGKLINIGAKPSIDKLLLYEADLIIQVMDKHNLLIKSKPVGPRNLFEEQKIGKGSKVEILGTVRLDEDGKKYIESKMSNVSVVG